MLRVPTFLAPSPIAGVGLFAATDLAAGTIIWEYTEGVDWRLSPEELTGFPEPYRSRLRHYVYEEDTGWFVLCGDNAKFMNHADTPNCDDPDGAFTVTNRLVRAGEELTCDYRSFDRDSRLNGMPFADPEADGKGNGRLRAARAVAASSAAVDDRRRRRKNTAG
jgi:SET domain-containing protein